MKLNPRVFRVFSDVVRTGIIDTSEFGVPDMTGGEREERVAGDAETGDPRLEGIAVIVRCSDEMERDETDVRNKAFVYRFNQKEPPCMEFYPRSR